MEKSVRVNDETVPAFPLTVAIVQRPCELDDPRPFFNGVGCGIFGEAGGFGVEEEEHYSVLDIIAFGSSGMVRTIQFLLEKFYRYEREIYRVLSRFEQYYKLNKNQIKWINYG
ncbi:MAG: hypothetical protein WC379_05950 [Methanoregula sp.]|jgi:hypothetical protein